MTVFRLLLTVLCSITMLTAGPAPGSIPPDLASYGLEGAVRLSYRDVDAVCERPELAARAQAMLETLEEQDDLLLSFLVDGSVGIGRDALGPYDHLVIVNQAWVDRTDPQAQLTPIELMALPEGMQGLLTDQMPVWTGDGSVLPAGARLCQYRGNGLLALRADMGGGLVPVLTQHPLVLVLDRPAHVMKASSFLVPLSSTGNLLFADAQRLRKAAQENGLGDQLWGISILKPQ